MPRIARKKSSTGIYHVVLRGINKQRIFEDDQDKYLNWMTTRRDDTGVRFSFVLLAGGYILFTG